MAQRAVDIESLTSEEQLDLLERLWDKLSEAAGMIPLTEAQKLELDRRSDELDDDIRHGRPLGIPWDEVLKQIRSHR